MIFFQIVLKYNIFRSKKRILSTFTRILSKKLECFYNTVRRNGGVILHNRSVGLIVFYAPSGGQSKYDHVLALSKRRRNIILKVFETGPVTQYELAFRKMLPEGHSFASRPNVRLKTVQASCTVSMRTLRCTGW